MDRPSFYFGRCSRCCKAVSGEGGACEAMGRLFHSACFTCCLCGKSLCGASFYTLAGQIYCEEDFLLSGVRSPSEVCDSCGNVITDLVLQACGKSYHPPCFRCIVCKQRLEGQPFTVDSTSRVYCVNDFYRVQAPLCAACRNPILPTEGSTESIRVASSDGQYHIECYDGEVSLI